MAEPDSRKSDSRGPSRERSRDDVLAAGRPLPPDEDVLIDDLTEDEDHLFIKPATRRVGNGVEGEPPGRSARSRQYRRRRA